MLGTMLRPPQSSPWTISLLLVCSLSFHSSAYISITYPPFCPSLIHHLPIDLPSTHQFIYPSIHPSIIYHLSIYHSSILYVSNIHPPIASSIIHPFITYPSLYPHSIHHLTIDLSIYNLCITNMSIHPSSTLPLIYHLFINYSSIIYLFIYLSYIHYPPISLESSYLVS